MGQIIRQAKINGAKKSPLRLINHLSPSRNVRNYKENEDLKSVNAVQTF